MLRNSVTHVKFDDKWLKSPHLKVSLVYEVILHMKELDHP